MQDVVDHAGIEYLELRFHAALGHGNRQLFQETWAVFKDRGMRPVHGSGVERCHLRSQFLKRLHPHFVREAQSAGGREIQNDIAARPYQPNGFSKLVKVHGCLEGIVANMDVRNGSASISAADDFIGLVLRGQRYVGRVGLLRPGTGTGHGQDDFIACVHFQSFSSFPLRSWP